MQRRLSENLRESLLAVLAGTATVEQLNSIVRRCHSLAIACIQSKNLPGLLQQTHGLSVGDIGMDCIAELFQRNEQGEFVQLGAFFGSLSLASCSDEEVLMHLRRLVFSKTHNGLFRIFNEADPTLGKILRNIKLAVQSLGQFEERSVLGEPAIVPASCDALEHLPPPDRETLERALAPGIRGNETIPSMLAVLARYLRDQRMHRRTIPLIEVAITFRSLYSRPTSVPEKSEDPTAGLMVRDVELAVRSVQRQLFDMAEHSYVRRGKVCIEVLDMYLRAIDRGIRATYVDLDGKDFSLYESLSAEMPDLTLPEYRKNHRARVEYLSRFAHQQMRKILKES